MVEQKEGRAPESVPLSQPWFAPFLAAIAQLAELPPSPDCGRAIHGVSCISFRERTVAQVFTVSPALDRAEAERCQAGHAARFPGLPAYAKLLKTLAPREFPGSLLTTTSTRSRIPKGE